MNGPDVMPDGPWVVVGCGAKKQPLPAPAWRLYIGTYTTDALNWARSVTRIDRVLILSAKYGLIPALKTIAPYNLRMGQPGSVTAEQVAAQARELGVYGQPVTVVAAAPYRRLLAASGAFATVTAPFAKAGGLGHQRHALRTNHARLNPLIERPSS